MNIEEKLIYYNITWTWDNYCCRESFSSSIQLGHSSYPVSPAPSCELVRTQADPRSSIRACVCTQDFCNIVPDGRSEESQVVSLDLSRQNSARGRSISRPVKSLLAFLVLFRAFFGVFCRGELNEPIPKWLDMRGLDEKMHSSAHNLILANHLSIKSHFFVWEENDRWYFWSVLGSRQRGTLSCPPSHQTLKTRLITTYGEGTKK